MRHASALGWIWWVVLVSPQPHGAWEGVPDVPGRTPMTNLVGVILHTHFQQPYTTTHVVLRSQSENGRRGLLEMLTTLLADHVRGQLVVQFEVRGLPRASRWQRLRSHTLLLAEDYDALHTFYEQLTLDRYDFAGYYLIVLTSGSTTLATIDRIFHDFWQRQIVNVIVAFGSAQAGLVQLWTYYPYSPGLCRVPKPHRVLTWPNDTLLYGVDFFPRKNANFHGCPLQVGTFETRPFTVLLGTPAAPALGGFEGDLLASAAAKLHFAVSLRVPPHAQQWGVAAFENSTGMMRMLYRKEADLGIGCLGVSSERSAMLKPGKVHFTTELVVVVPPGRPYTPLEKLFQPFRPALWGAIAASAALGLLALGAARRFPAARRYLVGRRVQWPGLNMLRLLVGGPVPHPPAAGFPRTLLLLWIQCCLVLQAGYQGALFTVLQRASAYPPMATLAEIDRAGARYHVTDSARRFFEPFPQRLARLQFLPPGPDAIAARLRWIGRHPHDPDVTLCTRDHVAHYNRQHRPRLAIAREPMALYTVTILYPKQSMLPTSFDEHIERIESSGLLKYWAARYGDYHFFGPASAAAGQPAPISVDQLCGAFQLLLALLAASAVVLLGEVYWVRKVTAGQIPPAATG